MAQGSRISIVLPTYNGSRYLREAIQSCLDQSYEDWELIVVDDASTDETPSIIAAFAAQDERIRAIRNQTNRMLPGSLNVGFAAARGELLSWTSDDNLYRPHAMAMMAAVLEENPAVGFVYSGMNVIDGEGRPLGPAAWVAPPDQLPRASCIGASFLYRRGVMERVGRYDESLPLVEDYDFWMRVSRQARMHYLPEDLYLYRTHDRSLTATRHDAAVLAFIRCQAKNLPDMDWVRGIGAGPGAARVRLVGPLSRRSEAGAGMSLAFAPAPPAGRAGIQAQAVRGLTPARRDDQTLGPAWRCGRAGPRGNGLTCTPKRPAEIVPGIPMAANPVGAAARPVDDVIPWQLHALRMPTPAAEATWI